jgi:hypothetical protein
MRSSSWRSALVQIVALFAPQSVALCLGHGGAKPAAFDAVRQVLTDHGGRCSLARVGEHLRAAGATLPEGTSLSDFVRTQPGLQLSGPPSNRRVSFAAQTTQAALVQLVADELCNHGPMTSAELRRRLSARRRFVPGLSALLRENAATFSVNAGTVSLLGPPVALGQPPTSAAAMVRLRELALPTGIDEADIAAWAKGGMREVLLLDLDNRAFLSLEAAASNAVERQDVLLLLCCSAEYNPRLPANTADALMDAGAEGRVRVISPVRGGKNAADFVLAFWAGALHARLGPRTTFAVVSEDDDLRDAVGSTLGSVGRESREKVARQD